MPCPWYQFGLCTSPKLPEPTDAVVAVDRCNSEDMYVNCVYYLEEVQRSSARKTSSTKRDRARLYLPIHALPLNVECSCPECEVSTTENGVKVAYCKVLDRYLTRYEVYTCNRYWRDCPFRYFQTT